MIERFDCEQCSPEWFAVRLGIPTTSEFHTVLAKGQGIVRKTYMLKLAGEILTGEQAQSYSNDHMDRGKAMEAEARTLYAFMYDADTESVGFLRNGRKGWSPDSLIGDNGGLEIKTALPHILIDKLLKDDFPPEHKAQVQGGLWVGEREWIDLVIYWPKLPLFVKRAYRDDVYIKTLSDEVTRFNEELDAAVEKIKAHGMARAA
jgi:hypothetical protein